MKETTHIGRSSTSTESHDMSDEISQDEVKYCLDVMLKNPTAFIIHIRDREELDRSNAVMMLHMIAKRVETPAGADSDQTESLRRGPSTDTLVALSTVTNKIDFFITSVVNQWNHFKDFQNNAQDGICDTGAALCQELDEIQRKVSLETLEQI